MWGKFGGFDSNPTVVNEELSIDETNKDEILKDNKMSTKTNSNVDNLIGGAYSIAVTADQYKDAYRIDENVASKLDRMLKALPEDDTRGVPVVVELNNGFTVEYVDTLLPVTLGNKEEVAKAKFYVVDVIDTSAQLARIEGTERYAYIQTRLEEKKKEVEAVQMFEMLAKYDTEAAELLTEMKKLGNLQMPTEGKPTNTVVSGDGVSGE